MRHFALIGYPVEHSLSKQLFDEKGFSDADYRLHPTRSLAGLRQWAEVEKVEGFNVTSPYKTDILALLDGLSAEAEAIGAVNCVRIERGRWVGHNTDAPAFAQMLTEWTARESLPMPQEALVMGTGGAARAVRYALMQMGVRPQLVSRTPHEGSISYAAARALLRHRTLLINATPVGMPPMDGESAWPWAKDLAYAAGVVDLIYNPSPTPLLRGAQQHRVPTCDGYAMLRLQAERSWQLWGLC